MTKILLITSAAISLAAAALGFLNYGKLQATRMQVKASANQLAEKQRALDAAQNNVHVIRKENAELTDQRDKLAAGFGNSKEELAQLLAALDTEKARFVAADEARANAELELRKAIDQINAFGESSHDPTSIALINQLRAQVATLQDVAATQAIEINRLKGGPTPSGTISQGTIVAVNQAWNFVVLNLGSRQGIARNAEMLVQRGNQLIGKVRVTSVEKSNSIADIIVRTIPRGLTIMPGDTVISHPKRN